VTKELNHAGVYQVRLCRSGVWHCVVIDDVLPVNGLSCLAYLKAARRSLWPCLIEKAAAKLNGSYEALNGGTFAEAFGMLTGCPVQRVNLRLYKEPPDAPPTATEEERQAHRRQLDKWRAKKYDTDELYYRLYSYKEAGFVIGCSTFFTKEAEIQEARATGIQVPHAYCLLDMKESPNDEAEPLVKLRNPNGHAGWRGDWSRSSSKWTYEAKQALAIDHEDSGVFWMTWADFLRLFAEVTICRLRTDYVDARVGGWLPSVFGAGQAVMVEVYAHTQLELSVHQEMHSNRGESAIATLVDLGVAVMKVGGGDGGGDDLSLVARGERAPFSSVSIDTPLALDGYSSRYLLVPLCFGHLGSPEPRKFVTAALSNQPLSIETVDLQPKQLASAMISIAVEHGEKQTLLNHPMFGPMLNLYTLDDEAGYALVAENPTMHRVRFEMDAADRTRGFVSSRGALFCQDVLPPRTRQLIIVLSLSMQSKTHSLGMQFGGGVLQPTELVPDGAGHIPALADLGALAPLHEAQPIVTGGAGAEWQQQQQPGGTVDVAALASSILSQMNPR